MTEPTIFAAIRNDITANDVVLYMKGTRDMPMCGFSAAVVQILTSLNIPFKDVNVLASDDLRQGIKDFTNWPTIPQLYIGGCDIVREMHQSGELQALLKDKGLLAA
jgi:monothiol glutaredoxin